MSEIAKKLRELADAIDKAEKNGQAIPAVPVQPVYPLPWPTYPCWYPAPQYPPWQSPVYITCTSNTEGPGKLTKNRGC